MPATEAKPRVPCLYGTAQAWPIFIRTPERLDVWLLAVVASTGVRPTRPLADPTRSMHGTEAAADRVFDNIGNELAGIQERGDVSECKHCSEQEWCCQTVRVVDADPAF